MACPRGRRPLPHRGRGRVAARARSRHRRLFRMGASEGVLGRCRGASLSGRGRGVADAWLGSLGRIRAAEAADVRRSVRRAGSAPRSRSVRPWQGGRGHPYAKTRRADACDRIALAVVGTAIATMPSGIAVTTFVRAPLAANKPNGGVKASADHVRLQTKGATEGARVGTAIPASCSWRFSRAQ